MEKMMFIRKHTLTHSHIKNHPPTQFLIVFELKLNDRRRP